MPATTSHLTTSAELFDTQFLKKLEYLNLIARRMIFGRRQALRASVKKGASIEFRDFREYTPGDDPRSVDWSVYARLGHLMIKLFRQEEELDLWVLLDASGSMNFGDPNKFDMARRIAAALSYIGLVNMDSAGVVPFDVDLDRGLTKLRGRGQIFRVMNYLAALPATGQTDLGRTIRDFSARVRRPSLVVIMSDFYGLESAMKAVDRLRFFKHEIYIIQLASPWEIDPPLRGELRLVDVENSAHDDLTITDSMLRKYRAEFKDLGERLRRYCMKHAIGYALADTSVPFDQFVRRLLERGGLLT